MSGVVDGSGAQPGPSDDRAGLADLVESMLRTVPDFPEPGVQFRDIMPLLADGDAFARVVTALAGHPHGPVDLVAGMEARGFLLAAPVAVALGAGVVPVRKAGKLPGLVASQSYALEYGSASVEIQPSTVPAGARVLVIDDVLATGGTAAATVELLESCGATVVGLSFLVELGALDGRALLPGRDVDVLLTLP
ncbi:adenine phosphoribosyltransferase [Cellulomonas dongxiuzhuiae]|uniref:Adenine phosphoribosyltransferase n=1 Tax=Cellulomonas dongxiuzhuiae TaxID=2819979 RepID=A0ABX8GQN1_9CELL|nr:adenine phosphoribosyltransferase [Cellulomonas dongxiuzhuiae]MBO3087234.1 adenine phosphoribosyltransferase [Cellulomonas dongxiuzhuiae]MBO3093369.1 adenine phosphoribosyltransferase [Cellulomonas dongxiuzhuiae]QWC17644.1 adenine phosphoribosyltransferase [Cellulomonas dongxiuzhuiae]